MDMWFINAIMNKIIACYIFMILVFAADEILNFSQEDLACDDVMLLDSWHSVFLWMGNSCNRVSGEFSFHLSRMIYI